MQHTRWRINKLGIIKCVTVPVCFSAHRDIKRTDDRSKNDNKCNSRHKPGCRCVRHISTKSASNVAKVSTNKQLITAELHWRSTPPLPGKVLKTCDAHLQCCPRATGWAGLGYNQVAYLFGVSGRLKTAERICTDRQPCHTAHQTRDRSGNIHALLHGLVFGYFFILIPNHALISPVAVTPFGCATTESLNLNLTGQNKLLTVGCVYKLNSKHSNGPCQTLACIQTDNLNIS